MGTTLSCTCKYLIKTTFLKNANLQQLKKLIYTNCRLHEYELFPLSYVCPQTSQ